MEGAEISKEAPRIYRGVGEIVSLGKGELLVRHGDIPSAGMGAMTMPFLTPADLVPPGLKKGDHIRFEFTAQSDGQFRITSIASADASLPDHGAHK